MAGASTSEDAVTRDLPKIIAWMQSLGLAARKSRYSRYEKHIEAFYSKHADQLSEDGEERFDSLSQAYRECIDIFMVYKCFNGVIHPNFVSKLRHVVTGQDVPDLEMAGPSRDYLFELLVAARFKMAGFSIDFDESSDVVASRGELTIRAECKRLASEKKLSARINYAAGQLETAMRAAERDAFGVIFIDVSSCLVDGTKKVVASASDARGEITAAVNQFVRRNGAFIEAQNHRHMHVSLGTCLIGTLPIWTPDRTMHSSTCMSDRAAEDLSDVQFGQLQTIFSGFDETYAKAFV